MPLKQPARHIGISFGQISSLVDGLGEFSARMAEGLALQAEELAASHGIRIHLHMPAEWHGRFGQHVSYVHRQSIHRYVHWSRTRFDIWHTLNQMSKLAPPLRSRHRIMTIHDLNDLYTTEPTEHARVMQPIRQRLKPYDHVTTLTHYVEQDIVRHLGWREPIEVIPNGVRDLTTLPAESIQSLEEKTFFFHLSRMAPSKNPQSLLALAATWPDQQFVLAGPGSNDLNRVRAEVNDRQLRNVTVLENITDGQKVWLYQHCRAFLFPSLTEGFGLPPLEAMQFGKPVFVARRTCLPEVVGEWGSYFDDFSSTAMRQVIERDLPRLAAATDRIKAHAAGYAWDRTVRKYIALYLRLMQHG